MRRRFWLVAYVLLMAFSISSLTGSLRLQGKIRNLRERDTESSGFRRQELSEPALEKLLRQKQETGCSIGELLSVWMPRYGYALKGDENLEEETYQTWKGYYEQIRPGQFESLQKAYQAIWDDVEYFPVSDEARYENSWMAERTYGGKRGHEGTDLMPPKNRAGYYPVYSMTDGVVERMGWLPQGGWRIGIRSPGGAYFYYAHLDSYAQGLEEGSSVQAGEMLGYMGDTGYGSEGTRGKFDVHLHLGIYIRTERFEELSVNPYWVLRSAEGHKLKYHGDLCYNQIQR